jgi:hypothetical protein
LVAAGCLALAVASLAFPAAPTYDPWAWLVFGREVVVPSLGLSTVAFTGWKPLPVLFTAPLALFGAAAPSLWLVVVRTAGLAVVVLAFGLAARVGGLVAGAIAAVAVLACESWLRFLSAGNVEPLVVAFLLGAIELHLRGRRGAAFLLAALVGLARPEVWPLLGAYAVYLTQRPALVAARGRHPGHARAVDRARLDRLGRSAPHFHSAQVAASRTRSSARAPLARAVRGAAPSPGAGVDRHALGAGVVVAQPRPHRRRAGPRGGGVDAAHRDRHRLGYPAVPRYR